MTKNKQIEISLFHVGPHENTSLKFSEGVNILRGQNGIGKSTFLSAATAAFGGKSDVSIKDGHHTGTVLVDGVTVLQLGKRLTKTGAPTVELGGFGVIHDVIDPGIKDPALRDAATIKAILAMSPVEVTPAVVKELTGGDAEMMAIPLPADAPGNVLAVAEHFRRKANEMALAKEKEAERFKGAADAASQKLSELPLPQSTVTVSLAVAEETARAAQEKATQVALLAKQRKEMEERHERIKATLGECPDPAAAKIAVDDAVHVHGLAAKEVQSLRDQLAVAVKEAEIAEAAITAARKESARLHEAVLHWERQAAALQEPISGPVESDVEAARSHAALAKEAAVAAAAQEARKKVQDECGAALVGLEQANDRAKALRERAQGVSEALGVVLGRAGLDGFEVEDRRLYCRLGKERQLFAERFSFGQRAKVALTIALKAYKGRVVPVDPAFWAALDPPNKKTLDTLARESEVILVTEEPSADETITVGRVQ